MKNRIFLGWLMIMLLIGVSLQALGSFTYKNTVSPNVMPIVKEDSTVFTENTVDSVYLEAVEHLKSYEGFRSQVYLDTDGSRTIGYGHHLLRGEDYQNISTSLATEILKRDLNNRLEYIQAKYEITGDTLLALGLFSFNCGLGSLNKAIKNGLLERPKNILNYCHYKTYNVQGDVIWHTSFKLLQRRKYELALITNTKIK